MMAAAAAAAVFVEDEPIHEFYACLVESSLRSRATSPVCHSRRIEERIQMATIPHRRDRSRGHHPHQHRHDDATLIPLIDDHHYCSKEPSSQFIKFYRKSCQSHHSVDIIREERRPKQTADHSSSDASPSIKPKITIASKTDCKINHSTQQPLESSKLLTKLSTKAERRRKAKQEREKQVQTDKRIRFMLHSDFTQHDYDLLYHGVRR